MSIGGGLIQGNSVSEIVSITPDSIVYITHTGATFTQQDDGGSGNIAFYEINNQSDTIDFNLNRFTRDYNNPAMTVNTVFGSTDFDVYDITQERTIISEQSGYDTDAWIIDIDNTSSRLRLTNFDDTQAAFYPYINVFDKII